MTTKRAAMINSGTRLRLFVTDWSGVISDDRKPVYETNMQMLERRGKPRMSFGEWLPRTTMTPIEFLAGQGVVVGNGDENLQGVRTVICAAEKGGQQSQSL